MANAASGVTGPLAPGEVTTVFGLNLGPVFPYATPMGVPASRVGGTAILFNGVPGLVLFTSPTQVNVIVPGEIGNANFVTVEAENNGVRTSAGDYPVSPRVPPL